MLLNLTRKNASNQFNFSSIDSLSFRALNKYLTLWHYGSNSLTVSTLLISVMLQWEMRACHPSFSLFLFTFCFVNTLMWIHLQHVKFNFDFEWVGIHYWVSEIFYLILRDSNKFIRHDLSHCYSGKNSSSSVEDITP